MKKSIFFVLSLLLTTIYTYAQEKGKVKKELPTQNSQYTSLKTLESKNAQQQTDVKLKLAMLKAAKKNRSKAKKAKRLTLKSRIDQKKQLEKKKSITEKTEKTIALKAKLKQKKQLIKERAYAERIERKDKKQLEKALVIAKKEESKKIKNTSKIERTLVFQSKLKQKKQLTRQKIIAEKMIKKAKNQLELALAVSEKETFKKLKIRTQKEITLALKVQLAQKKLLLKQRSLIEKNAQRTKIQSDIAQIITTKQALKKAKMIAYDGEVRKIYR